MVVELLLGVVCGIVLSLLFGFGPAFFSQIQISLQYGFKKAYPFAFGVSAGDVIIVFLMLTVLKNIDCTELLHNVWVVSIGSLALGVMGFISFRKKVSDVSGEGSRIRFESKGGTPRRATIFAQGFIINFVNPFIWIYWVSVIALLSGETDLTLAQRYIFFLGLLLTTLALDVLKCKLASLLHRIITAKVLNTINKVTAVIMFVFAAYFLIAMINYQTNPEAREREQQQSPQSTEMIRKIRSFQPDSLTLHLRGPKHADSGRREDSTPPPIL